MRLFAAAIAAVGIVATAGGPAAAQGSGPLPAFTVVTPAGQAVDSGHLTTSERWLLVYVSPASVASDRLLPALEEWASADGARVVIVTAGPAVSIDTHVRARLSTQSLTAVYADTDGGVGRALALTSVPALVGIERGVVQWIVQGVLNDPRMVEPVVRSWLARP